MTSETAPVQPPTAAADPGDGEEQAQPDAVAADGERRPFPSDVAPVSDAQSAGRAVGTGDKRPPSVSARVSRRPGRLRRPGPALVFGVLLGIGSTAGLLELPSHATAKTASTPCSWFRPGSDLPLVPSSQASWSSRVLVPPNQPTVPMPPLPDSPSAVPSQPSPAAAAQDRAGPATAPTWVARTASDRQTTTTTPGAVLAVRSPVTAGDALIVTMFLTDTCPGRVAVTDSQSDQFQDVGDVTGIARERVLVLAAFDVRPLAASDSITLSYPDAGTYTVAVDEFRGIHEIRAGIQRFGEVAAGVLAGSNLTTTCEPGDLGVDAAGSRTYTAVYFNAPWHELPVVPPAPYNLTTGWDTTTTTGPCLASGTAHSNDVDVSVLLH
ncbi:hypothetical protein [Kitasatospora kifunensis]|uniref:Uncharacterized protein n=1 Tax=Kitasatospora kifunensis TaxID=58351 RepID=A0A7W7RBJ3_KITKI|nr:hypothetical protein [Kitasatospora kifunensis]MBB4928346.1 hypothetical protein [Kitasatospora kifunensis]